MPDNPSPMYEIRVRGSLDARWLRWFEGLQTEQSQENETTFRGAMDQAALHGVLTRIRDLGIELISVVQMNE